MVLTAETTLSITAGTEEKRWEVPVQKKSALFGLIYAQVLLLLFIVNSGLIVYVCFFFFYFKKKGPILSVSFK